MFRRKLQQLYLIGVAFLLLTVASQAMLPTGVYGNEEMPTPFGEFSALSRPTFDELIAVLKTCLAHELEDIRTKADSYTEDRVQEVPEGYQEALIQASQFVATAAEQGERIARTFYQLERALYAGDYQEAYELAGECLRLTAESYYSVTQGDANVRSAVSTFRNQVDMIEEYITNEGISSLQLFTDLQQDVQDQGVPDETREYLLESGLTETEIDTLKDQIISYDPREMAIMYEKIYLNIISLPIAASEQTLPVTTFELALLQEGLSRTRIDLIDTPPISGWWVVPSGAEPSFDQEEQFEGMQTGPLAPGLYDIYATIGETDPQLVAESINVILCTPTTITW